MPDGSVIFVPDNQPQQQSTAPPPVVFVPDNQPPQPVTTAPTTPQAPAIFVPDSAPPPSTTTVPVPTTPAAPQMPIDQEAQPSLSSVVTPPSIDPALAAATASAGGLGQLIAPTPAPPPAPGTDTGEGFFSGLGSGFIENLQNKARMARGETFVTPPNQPPPVQRGFFNELGHGLGGSSDMLVGGIGGGALGAEVGGPIGGVVGAALGVGGAAALGDMAPAYDSAIRAGKTHEEAVDYAITHATATGVISGLTAPLLSYAPVKSALGKILFQAFATQPATGAATRIGVPAVMGEPLPTPGELVRGYGQDVMTGGGFALGTHGPAAVREAVTPAPPPPVPSTSPVDIAARGAFAPGGGAPEVTVAPPTPSPAPEATVAAPAAAPPAPERAGAPPEAPATAPVPAPSSTPPTEAPVETSVPQPAATVEPPAPTGEQPAPPTPSPPAAPEAPLTGRTEVLPATSPETRPTTEPGVDRSAAPTGEPTGAAPVGEGGAPGVETPGVRAPAGGEGNQGGGARGPAGTPAGGAEAPAAEAGAQPKEPTAAVSRLDQLRNEYDAARREAMALEGAGQSEALRTAYRRVDEAQQAYENELAAQRQEPSTAAPAAEPAGAPTAQGEPARRPVTKNELDALEKRARTAQQVLNRAERDPTVTPERLDALRQRAEAAGNEWRNAEGPPSRPYYRTGLSAKEMDEAHRQALEEHAAAIDRRIHAEGEPAPEPVTSNAGKVFTQMGGGDARTIVSKDSKGNSWIGTGHVLLKTVEGKNPLARTAAARSEKTKPYEVNPQGLDKVVTPDPKGDYQEVTWHRRVTDSEGRNLVLGQLPNGKWVALQRPVYDALHVAAGKDGVVVAPTKGSDARFFARRVVNEKTGRVEDVAVGMPINIDQAKAEIWARGEGAQKSADLRAPVLADRAAGAGTRETGPMEPARPETDLFGDPVERQAGPGTTEEPGAAPETSTLAEPLSTLAEPLTTEPDHVVPNQYVAKDASGEVVGKGPTPEAALADARGEPTSTGVPQLDRLMATRDRLQADLTASRSPARQRFITRQLQGVDQQIERLRQSAGVLADEQAAQDRVAGRRVPSTGQPPSVAPREDFMSYKFNDGTSVYRSVFEQAGYDPDIATNWTLERQNDILTRHLENVGGFQDVSVSDRGTPVDDYHARNTLLDMTRAIQDMMASLGQPYEAASLNGRLSLIIEPSQKPGPFGSYEPGTGIIRVAGGANSFGHEWTHAIDHYLAERLTGQPMLRNNLLTKYARAGQLDPKDGVMGAFARVLNTLFYDKSAQALREISLRNEAARTDKQGNPTKGALDAQRQLQELERAQLNLRIQPTEFRANARSGPSAGYYANPVELLARAHEAYLARQMVNNGVNPRGVVMPDEAYINETDRQLKLYYPKAQDRVAIFNAFDELHAEMRKADILSEGKPPAPFPNLGISDPAHYGATAPAMANTPQAAQNRAAINSWKNRTRTILQQQRAMLYDPNRPPPPPGLNQLQRFRDSWRSVLAANENILKLIRDRAPKAAQAAAQEIIDRVTNDPGSGRYQPEFLEEAARARRNQWARIFVNVLKNSGFNPKTFDKITSEEDAMIRHAMITGETSYPPDPNNPSVTKSIPPNLIKAAGGLRQLMDTIWDKANAVGLDIGYQDRYFPRLIDRASVFNDQAGFTAQAKKVYEIIFNRDVGAPGSDPQALLEKWTTLSKEDRQLVPPGSTLPQEMAELYKNIRRQNEIEQNPNPTAAERAELAQLKIDAQAMATAAHPGLQDHVTNLAANDYYARLAEPGIHGFDTTHATGRFLNARTLPPEADVLLRDYYHSGIGDAIPHYLDSVARRTADAERFGPQGEHLERLVTAMREGDMHPDDLQWFVNTIADIRGQDKPRNAQTQRLVSTVHAATSMYLMERSLWAGLSEPANTYAVTGRAKDALRTFGMQFGSMIDKATREERTDIADIIGTTDSAMQSTVAMSRMGADYADSPLINRWMSRFYRTIGLTGTVNSQRANATAALHSFIEKVAQDFQQTANPKNKADAARWLNDMGIPPTLHETFSKWVTDLGGQRPSSTLLLKDPMSGAYGLAVRRLVDRVNQAPYRVHRAAGASSSRFAMMFQLMSFNYSFARNVMKPAIDRIEHSAGEARIEAQKAGAGPVEARVKGLVAGGGTMMHTAAIASAMLGAAIPPMLLRLWLFDKDRFDQMMEDISNGDVGEMIDQAWSRAGLNAQFDPIVQAFSHSKYDANISSLIEGAGPNFLSKNILNVLQDLLGENAAHTNTRDFRAWQSGYNLAGIPLAAVGLTGLNQTLQSVPGPLGIAARVGTGLALQYLTSPKMASEFAESRVGPKGTKDPEYQTGGAGGTPGVPGLPTLPKLPTPGMPGKGGGPEAAAQDEGGINAWGLLDDILVPAWRKIGPVLSKIPGPYKAGAIGAGALGGLYEANEAGAKYRDAAGGE